VELCRGGGREGSGGPLSDVMLYFLNNTPPNGERRCNNVTMRAHLGCPIEFIPHSCSIWVPSSSLPSIQIGGAAFGALSWAS
jgi:hypothetical protein